MKVRVTIEFDVSELIDPVETLKAARYGEDAARKALRIGNTLRAIQIPVERVMKGIGGAEPERWSITSEVVL